ncbi:MAG: Methyltransferase type 11 [Candidatus Kaiserbacteria bacterium GW2011_GWA2_49_19]|uniref:Methyltransferase type 11 n=1 Tax=Candidatus Kaiserbacteria bacterium GW2011_GWA2_49_19 TaxID=1618669 RepID=A0A0G1Y386_9BACT|nr:MAG: Methyltransferase type 11 [Candidatus Kaiserbacteria bacterium GW2011_GWA2_49_19]
MAILKTTKQLSHWAGEHGNAYVDRNPHSPAQMNKLYKKDYGVTRTYMNEEFLGRLGTELSILEFGANVGTQLQFLRERGFSRLLGIDINQHAVKVAKRLHPDVDVIAGSGFDAPFKDGSFEFVFTSGVLIHISPNDIKKIMNEMHRVSSRYIWGFEYYAPKYAEVTYRGKKDLLWKTDFAGLFLNEFPGLKLVKEAKYPMTDGVNVSQMYLLEKIK